MYKLENQLISLFIMIYLPIHQNIILGISLLVLIYIITTILLFSMNCGYELV